MRTDQGRGARGPHYALRRPWLVLPSRSPPGGISMLFLQTRRQKGGPSSQGHWAERLTPDFPARAPSRRPPHAHVGLDTNTAAPGGRWHPSDQGLGSGRAPQSDPGGPGVAWTRPGGGGRDWDREKAQLGAISFHPLHSQSRGPSWPVACGPYMACPLRDLGSWAQSCKHTVSEKKSSGRQQAVPGELEGAPGALAAVPTGTTHAVTQTVRLTCQHPRPRAEAAFRGH